MRVLIGMQNILDEPDERCGTPARMSARSKLRTELVGIIHRFSFP
jgi:hypothetical protein